MTWAERAACAGMDPDLWFPRDDADRYRGSYARARAVCTGCDVQAECLALAVRHGIEHGMWGGLAPNERHALRLEDR